MVARRIAGFTAPGLAGRARERVPDRRVAAIGRDRALDLVRRRRDAPDEALRQLCRSPRREGFWIDQGCHAFTAPSMTPPMMRRPEIANTTRIGRVASAVPARTSV